MSLVNKVAVVTGASSGIGAAIAMKLTEEDAKVTIVGRNEIKLKKVSDACEQCGHKPLTIVADVSKDEDAKKIISETVKCFGKLDILVNNAGIGGSCSILDNNAMKFYDKMMSINLRAPVYLTHLAANHLIEAKGNIVNVSSVASLKVLSSSHFAYSTSKAGLDHFTRCISLELSSKSVRVNTVNPGPVKTDIVENTGVSKAVENDVWQAMESATVLNKMAEPEEIADLVAFIVSEKGRSFTGSTIVTDNGILLKGPIT